jgi:hypothetical protein
VLGPVRASQFGAVLAGVEVRRFDVGQEKPLSEPASELIPSPEVEVVPGDRRDFEDVIGQRGFDGSGRSHSGTRLWRGIGLATGDV